MLASYWLPISIRMYSMFHIYNTRDRRIKKFTWIIQLHAKVLKPNQSPCSDIWCFESPPHFTNQPLLLRNFFCVVFLLYQIESIEKKIRKHFTRQLYPFSWPRPKDLLWSRQMHVPCPTPAASLSLSPAPIPGVSRSLPRPPARIHTMRSTWHKIEVTLSSRRAKRIPRHARGPCPNAWKAWGDLKGLYFKKDFFHIFYLWLFSSGVQWSG